MDFVTDNNPTDLYFVLLKSDLPDYVKEASVLTPKDTQGLSPLAFADIQREELPLHTKAATYLSAAYFLANQDKYTNPAIAQRLEKAAEAYGITEDVENLIKESSKKASVEQGPVFATTLDGEKVAGYEGESFGLYNVETPEDLIMSADTLLQDYRHNFVGSSVFKSASKNMCKLAAACGLLDILPQEIIQSGEERLPDFEKAASVATTRTLHVQVPAETQELYHSIIKAARQDYEESGYDPETVEKWASVWELLDQQVGITSYDSAVVSPYQALFSGAPVSEVEKLANTTVIIKDVMIPLNRVAAVDQTAIEYTFNKEAAALINDAVGCAKNGEAFAASTKLASLESTDANSFLLFVANQE